MTAINGLSADRLRCTAVAWVCSMLEFFGAYRLALNCLERWQAAGRESPELHLLAVRLCVHLGYIDQAAYHWKKGAGPYSAGFHYWLRRHRRLGLGKLEFTVCSEDEPAVTMVETKKEMQSGNCPAFGDSATEQEEPTVYRKLCTVAPANPVNWHNYALALAKAQKFADALSCFCRAQELGLNNADLWHNKGVCLFYLGRWEEAISCFELAREMLPQSVDILANLAACYQKIGNYDRAFHCYQAALRLSDYRDGVVLNNYALCLEEAGRREEALAFYDRALQVQPGCSEFLYNKAVCLAELGREDEALQVVEQILATQPNCSWALSLKGELAQRRGMYQEAAAAYGRALGLTAKVRRKIMPGRG